MINVKKTTTFVTNLKNLFIGNSKTTGIPQNLDFTFLTNVARQCWELKLSLIKRILDLLGGVDLPGSCCCVKNSKRASIDCRKFEGSSEHGQTTSCVNDSDRLRER